MSCETSSTTVATRAAPKNGISRTGSKSGFTAGSTPQVSFFVIAAGGAANSKDGKSVPKSATGGTQAGTRRGRRKRQKSGQSKSGPNKKTAAQPASVPKETVKGASAHRRIILGQVFDGEELSKLSVQLRLGLAAATRHLRMLNNGISRDTGHGDPRPADWARSDIKQFGTLTNQLTQARRARDRGKQGYLDLSSLKRDELVELWEFSRFEADRAMRNIDHLQTSGSGIGGATAEYLVKNHKLEARFYTHLANQIEAIFPAENIRTDYPTGTGGS